MTRRLLVFEEQPQLPPVSKTIKTPSPRHVFGHTVNTLSRVTSPGSLSYRPLSKRKGLSVLRQSVKEQSQGEILRTMRQERMQIVEQKKTILGESEKPAMLEILEAKWEAMPEKWSLERKVLECTLNPPQHIHALVHPISQSLILHLSHSPLGRKILSQALFHMPKLRLACSDNGHRITEALRNRSISSIQGFGPVRHKRNPESQHKLSSKSPFFP